MTEPCCCFRWKKRGKSPVNPFVICVKPFEFFSRQQFPDQSRSVYMAAGESLELKKITEFRHSSFLAEDYVLMTDSVHAFAIESGFV